jgi:hypothetical protein
MDGVKKEVKFAESTRAQSPSINESDISEISDATEGLEYINSQLVAHGFCKGPGLDLQGLSNAFSDTLLKCLMGLLSQRTVSTKLSVHSLKLRFYYQDDMSRTEQLSTKLRTLTYDFQRMSGMQQTAQEASEKAEREMNLHKSKMQSVQTSTLCISRSMYIRLELPIGHYRQQKRLTSKRPRSFLVSEQHFKVYAPHIKAN